VLTEAFLTSLIAGTVAAGIPLLLAGLGEQISEKAGVLNIGLEGMMLAGAYAAFVAVYESGSIWLGLAVGGLGGVAVAVAMAGLCVRLGLNQIVIGIALTVGLEGLTAILHHVRFSTTYPRLPLPEPLAIPGLADLPLVGESVFARHPVVYLAFLLVPAMAWVYRRTHVGLNLQAAGDKPAALDAAGVSVAATRAWAVLATGFLAGVGGAYLCVVVAGLFVPFVTAGAGFIAIVLAMLARGRPTWVAGGALLFGACLSVATAIQVAGLRLPTESVQIIPFAMVIVVLVLFGRRSYLPPALGLPYIRGDR
jgi:simple sugar transport system permease protein